MRTGSHAGAGFARGHLRAGSCRSSDSVCASVWENCEAVSVISATVISMCILKRYGKACHHMIF